MQSDSGSEGEFFDATESQNNSFDANSASKPKLHQNNKVKIKESGHVKHAKDREENILPQEKLKTKDDDSTKNTHYSEDNERKPIQENNLKSSTSKIIDNQHSPPIINPKHVDNNVQNSKVSHLELNLHQNTNKKDVVDTVKERSSSVPLSPVSEVLKSVVNEEHVYKDVVDGGGKGVQETETPAPVAPPRRKRKKKVEAKITTDNTVEDTQIESPISSTVSTPETTPSEILLCSSDPPTSEQLPIPLVAGTSEEGANKDPAITLDYKSTEMKQVLEKASSTEVIPAFTLDARRKSNSVTSLSSTCNRSDSFTSVSSVLSNGPTIKKTGSSTSISSIHTFQHSAGNHDLVRVRSESGRPLSDVEILEQVIVKNLDTGESIPLSLAEDRLPKGTNPLALHIMRLTSEYSSDSKPPNLDQEDGPGSKVKKKTKKLKSFLGRTVNKMKADKKVKEAKAGDESSSSDEEESANTPFIKIKSAHGKGPEEFEKLKLLQDLSGEHVGAIWTVKFSVCGRLMATAGQDHMVRVWVLKENEEYFEEMSKKYSKSGNHSATPDPEVDQILEQDEDNGSEQESENEEDEENDSGQAGQEDKDKKEVVEDDNGPFKKKPFCTYCGHTGDVLDLSWSKNYFLLSSSMDKTVRLWHISRTECLCCFQHIDFVTAIVFHPRDDRYFLSGSLDGKIRLWNIPDKKVALWNEVEGTGSNLITAANFCLQGRFAVVGTYDGRCIFYETEHLKYHTQWQVSPTRNKRSRGRKISGIEPMPGEEKVLITSNDSRIRLYDLKDNSLSCKYKGCSNSSSQIKASFSHDGQYLICGSEDHFAYIWRTQHGIPSARRDKNEFYESFSAHTAVVTVATFTPVPWLIVPPDTSGRPVTSEVLVTADWTGAIKLFVNT